MPPESEGVGFENGSGMVAFRVVVTPQKRQGRVTLP